MVRWFIGDRGQGTERNLKFKIENQGYQLTANSYRLKLEAVSCWLSANLLY